MRFELTPEQRSALSASPGLPLEIEDPLTHRVYLVIEQGETPSLDEEYIRDALAEGFAAVERGEVEEWDAAATKAEGRRLLEERRAKQ